MTRVRAAGASAAPPPATQSGAGEAVGVVVVQDADGVKRKMSRRVSKPADRANTAAEFLVHAALEHAASQADMGLVQLKHQPQGKRRHLHDDITVIVVDLAERRQRRQRGMRKKVVQGRH